MSGLQQETITTDIPVIAVHGFTVVYKNAAPVSHGAKRLRQLGFPEPTDCRTLAELLFGLARDNGAGRRQMHSVVVVGIRPDGTTVAFDLTDMGAPGNEALVFRVHEQ